jgi:iron complex transport system ATP-binding protein
MLSVQSVCVQWPRQGEAFALQGVSLRLAPGRWTAIVGPNGAGKSTLLKVMAGLQACTGQVLWQDRALADWPLRERARFVSWLGQAEGGGDDLRAIDVVALGRMPHQGWLAAPTAHDQAVVQQAMQQTHCWAWRDRPLSHLSGGERQRVLLARALAVQAPVLLMDEPLSHLDPPHQADWLAMVQQQRNAGTTVVSVLHELNMALMADELVVMAQGQVLHQGSPHDATTRLALQAVFDHRVSLHQVAGQWVALPLIV